MGVIEEEFNPVGQPPVVAVQGTPAATGVYVESTVEGTPAVTGTVAGVAVTATKAPESGSVVTDAHACPREVKLENRRLTDPCCAYTFGAGILAFIVLSIVFAANAHITYKVWKEGKGREGEGREGRGRRVRGARSLLSRPPPPPPPPPPSPYPPPPLKIKDGVVVGIPDYYLDDMTICCDSKLGPGEANPRLRLHPHPHPSSPRILRERALLEQ